MGNESEVFLLFSLDRNYCNLIFVAAGPQKSMFVIILKALIVKFCLCLETGREILHSCGYNLDKVKRPDAKPGLSTRRVTTSNTRRPMLSVIVIP